MDDVTRFPLAWPHGRRRTPSGQRQCGRFCREMKTPGHSWTSKRDITLNEAIKRLMDELERLSDATEMILSTNIVLRLDGLPRSGQPAPTDPGAALYFKLKGKPHCMPCDTFTKVEQNIAAIAAHIEATRRIERYGVADINQMFTSFIALPCPDTVGGKGWRSQLGFKESESPTLAEVDRSYRAFASLAHPDKNSGSHEWMIRINEARDMARQDIKS